MNKFYVTLFYFFITSLVVEATNIIIPPTADFNLSKQTSCITDIVTLTDTSLEAPTSWSWSFMPNMVTYQNGTDANSQHPEVIFNITGECAITLLVTNADGSNSITKSHYVVGSGTLPYSEDFTLGVPPQEGVIINSDGSEGWEMTTTTGSDGNSTRVIRMDNYQYNSPGQLDEFVLPSIDIAGVTNPMLYFDVAYAAFSASNYERLHIEYSTDCGATFLPTTFDKQNTDLATVGYQGAGWGPSDASHWRAETVDLSSYTGGEIILKFIQTAGYGNGLFIDNIRVETIDPPVADFNSGLSCLTNTVTLTDTSLEAPTSWSWSFVPNMVTYQNGTDANSQHPEVIFNVTGEYSISLDATNVNGSNSITKSHYVVGSGTLPYSEDFTLGVPPQEGVIINSDGSEGWEMTTTTGSDGNSTRVIRMDNYQYNSPGQLDEFVLPSIDISSAVQPILLFDVAYAAFGASNYERLHIEYSTDCGATFLPTTFDKQNTDLATVGYQGAGWGPSDASHWRAETVDLSSYTGGEIILKFIQTAGYGNGLFIDNIRVEEDAILAVADEELSKIRVYPNPSTGNIKIQGKQLSSDVKLYVYDIHGRQVFVKELFNVNETISIDLNDLSKGNYILQISSMEKVYHEKIILK